MKNEAANALIIFEEFVVVMINECNMILKSGSFYLISLCSKLSLLKKREEFLI